MGRKIKDVTTIDVVQKDYKVPISNLVTPKAYSCSLEQIAQLSGIILEVDERKRMVFLQESQFEQLESNKSAWEAFCSTHEDWILIVEEDHEEKTTSWVFGDPFPIVFSSPDWRFGDKWPMEFSS